MNTRKTSKGFTLVELLIVIAIIGVLASLIMPNLGSVMGKGDQVKAQNAARSISNAWIAAARTGTKSRMIAAKDIYGWAEKLARYGDMNEPTIWILDFDVAVAEKAAEGAPMPISVINRVGTSSQLNPEFKEYPLSWEVANRTEPNAPSGTPLVWSRGLKPNGSWDATDGVFKDEGGIMAFTDGHVSWYASMRDEESRTGLLKIYGQTQRTYNIGQAIRGGSANILRSDIETTDEGFEEDEEE